jgi:hypothetical protein
MILSKKTLQLPPDHQIARFDFLLPELHLLGLFTLRSQGPYLGVFHLPPDLDLARQEGASHRAGP